MDIVQYSQSEHPSLQHFHSTKFLSFVISSNSSCKSISLILSDKLGIKVFASSELSQHKLPIFSHQLRMSHMQAWEACWRKPYQAAISQKAPTPYGS